MKFSDFEIIKTSGEQHGNITHEDYMTRSGKRYPEKEVVGGKWKIIRTILGRNNSKSYTESLEILPALGLFQEGVCYYNLR